MLHRLFFPAEKQNIGRPPLTSLSLVRLKSFLTSAPFFNTKVLRCSARAGNCAASASLSIAAYPWSSVCFRRGQRLRFGGDDVKVFDTPHRALLRMELKSYLLSETNVNLTGVSGNGKSHNLVRLVMDLREEGHLVVFIQDLEEWLQDPLLILRELWFAEKVGLSVDKSELKSACSNDRLFTDEHGAPISGLLSSDVVRIKSYVNSARLQFHAKHSNRKFLMVVDQGNRLWKWKADAERCKAPDERVSVSIVERFLQGRHFDGVLFSASANNEGWDQRGQNPSVLHLSESVPSHVAQLLFPKAFSNSRILHLMGVEVSSDANAAGCSFNAYGGYALVWGKAEAACNAAPCTLAAELLVRQVSTYLQEKIDSYYAVLLATAIRKHTSASVFTCAFMEQVERGRNKASSAVEVYDHNLFEWRADTVWGLRPIFNDVLLQYQRHPLFKFDSKSPPLGVSASTVYEWHCLQILKAAGLKHEQIESEVCSDVLCECDFITVPHRERRVFRTTPGAPLIDIYVVRKSVPKNGQAAIELLAVQCTLSENHDDSFQRFVYERYEDNESNQLTPLEKCVQTLRKVFPSHATAKIFVHFLWIHGQENLSITSRPHHNKSGSRPIRTALSASVSNWFQQRWGTSDHIASFQVRPPVGTMMFAAERFGATSKNKWPTFHPAVLRHNIHQNHLPCKDKNVFVREHALHCTEDTASLRSALFRDTLRHDDKNI